MPAKQLSSPLRSYFPWRRRTWGEMLSDWRFWASLVVAGGVIAASIVTQTWPLLVIAGVIVSLEQAGVFKLKWWWKKKAKPGVSEEDALLGRETKALDKIETRLAAAYDVRLKGKTLPSIVFSRHAVAGESGHYAKVLSEALFSDPADWQVAMEDTLPLLVGHCMEAGIHTLDFSALRFSKVKRPERQVILARLTLLIEQVVATQVTPVSVVLYKKDRRLFATEQGEWKKQARSRKALSEVNHQLSMPVPSVDNATLHTYVHRRGLGIFQAIYKNVLDLSAQWMNVWGSKALPPPLIPADAVANESMPLVENTLSDEPRHRYNGQMVAHCGVLKDQITTWQRIGVKEKEAARLVTLSHQLQSGLAIPARIALAHEMVEDPTFLIDVSSEKKAQFQRSEYGGKLRLKKAYFHSQAQASEAFVALNRLPSDNTEAGWHAKILEEPLPPGPYSTPEQWEENVAAIRQVDREIRTHLDEFDKHVAHFDETAARFDATAAHFDETAAHFDETAAHFDETAARFDATITGFKQIASGVEQTQDALQEEVQALLSRVESLQEGSVESSVPQNASSIQPSSAFAQPHAMFGVSATQQGRSSSQVENEAGIAAAPSVTDATLPKHAKTRQSLF